MICLSTRQKYYNVAIKLKAFTSFCLAKFNFYGFNDDIVKCRKPLANNKNLKRNRQKVVLQLINHAFLHSPKMQNCSFPVVPLRGTADTVMGLPADKVISTGKKKAICTCTEVILLLNNLEVEKIGP